MSNEETKAKYNRIASDVSQLENFKNDVIEGKIGGAGGTQLYHHRLIIKESAEKIDGLGLGIFNTNPVQITKYDELYRALRGQSYGGGTITNVFSYILPEDYFPYPFYIKVSANGPNVETDHKLVFWYIDVDNSHNLVYKDRLSNWASITDFVFEDTVTPL